METKMNISPPKRINQIDKYLQLDEAKFFITSTKDAYKFIKQTTWNLYYLKRSKKDRGKILKYLCIITGWSYSHIKRLVGLAVKGKLHYKSPKPTKTSFTRKYTDADIELLAEFDNIKRRPNANALKHNFQRMYEKFNDERFVRLKDISPSHIYNLRSTEVYKYKSKTFTKTNPVQNSIGIRQKPEPNGEPGFLRVDSVHGGDEKGSKGMYYVNFVDEVLQWEIVIAVADLTQASLEELYKKVLVSFPVRIQNFHSDNGSELVNNYVAEILKDLQIKQTKSRPRKHNDNALVESKNGWVIRKHFGYVFRPKEVAPLVQEYLETYFNRYLNYHRACAFPVVSYREDGKKIVKYPQEEYKTPYEKLQSIDLEGKYLRDGLTYAKLDIIALEFNDYEFAKIMSEEYKKMMRKIKQIVSPTSVSS